MPAATPVESERKSSLGRMWEATESTDRLVLRWILITALTVFAFHRSLANLVAATRGDTLIGFVWTVFAAGLLAAIAVTLQPRTDRPIHDRQTDIIVGVMGLVLSLLLHAVLLDRYAMYFDLLRLDLVAMWLFVLSSTVVLFGIRPLIRYVWVWILLLAVFPLPYQILVVVLLGGGKLTAAVGTLLIAAFAAWICTRRGPRRGAIGALAAVLVGIVVLGVMAMFFPAAPLLAYQLVPSLAAVIVSAIGVFFYAHKGLRLSALNTHPQPLAARQVWAAVPLVTVVAVALSFVQLPVVPRPAPVSSDMLTLDRPLIIPPGWHQTDIMEFPAVASRLYGPGARMIRQQMTANVGNPDWDKLSAPRTVVMDTITTNLSSTLQIYPSLVVYNAPHVRFSESRVIDLGHGVRSQLLSGIDDQLLVTWNVLQWTWTNGSVAQRVLVASVDNHDDGAPFPKPGHSLPTLLNSLIVVLFRGNAAVENREPEFKDAGMLEQVGTALVTAQLEPSAEQQ
ncbi:hypothetical protein ACIA48_24370 [Mycobacterium sp. NPDC051804]|uniref:hypothetical protein n=1 Tax=Mycobacterium sp. NPDC051804 TaxID=3364295 RepID=UPI0037A056FC